MKTFSLIHLLIIAGGIISPGFLAMPALAQDDGKVRELQRVIENQQRQLEMQQITAALHRIDEGTYGDCISCGEAIALPRLEHDPLWHNKCLINRDIFQFWLQSRN